MRRLIAALVALAACVATFAHAAYPEKPVRLIMPFPAGGSGDFVARALAQRLSDRLVSNGFEPKSPTPLEFAAFVQG